MANMTIQSIEHAQQDMRDAYASGATGVLASSIAWYVSAGVALTMTPQKAVIALFIGGMFIFPLSVVISKLVKRSGAHAKDNPLAGLAMENTVWMIAMLPIAYLASLLRIEYFFPAMMLIIGGRYLTFKTLYGLRVYWVCGFALIGAGFALGMMRVSPVIGAFTGATIELVIAVYLFATSARKSA
jgi:hypothetical protein